MDPDELKEQLVEELSCVLTQIFPQKACDWRSTIECDFDSLLDDLGFWDGAVQEAESAAEAALAQARSTDYVDAIIKREKAVARQAASERSLPLILSLPKIIRAALSRQERSCVLPAFSTTPEPVLDGSGTDAEILRFCTELGLNVGIKEQGRYQYLSITW